MNYDICVATERPHIKGFYCCLICIFISNSELFIQQHFYFKVMSIQYVFVSVDLAVSIFI